MAVLFGPFTQLVTHPEARLRGPLMDEELVVIPEGGILVREGMIQAVGPFAELSRAFPHARAGERGATGPNVVMAGLIDCHTHLIFAGSRARDYAARNAGKTYQEIAAAGGGIKDTLRHTRAASDDELLRLLRQRLDRHLRSGVTTVEVKTGYGLSVAEELRMLRLINRAGERHPAAVVPTCLAAHLVPPEMPDERTWLTTILEEIVPVVTAENLARRFDIFVEQGAFSVPAAREYLLALKERGFDLTVHGDQFSVGGSQLAAEVGARSVDHLEVSGAAEIATLAASRTIATALPGASIGLGCAFTPARKLLDAGAALAIASDWNPGSAPQGDLLAQAAILGTFEKLSTAEVLAGITFRAAAALGLSDRGRLAAGQRADFISFPTQDYREILYHQGSLKPNRVWISGSPII
ncbi:imidazolonepropionase [Lewinella sp. W8]|uniref:imidazolonepropionase n=1 Tax=Lewinella sp. W8 TaxID=2528208 RepID=UPI001068C38E|nr:imidazolonepropionase [Lewinella sp. W8]MTB50716.1 imidazolonepropionase [Lewinella sp. W8]